MVTSLTYEQALVVCRAVSAICSDSYVEAICKKGFTAFLPIVKWKESYCANAAELETHRRYCAELSRLEIINPFPMREVARSEQLVSSDYLSALAAKRDKENGVPFERVGDRYPGEIWRWDMDPGARHLMREKTLHRAAFDAKWTRVLESVNGALREEVTRHGSGHQAPSALSTLSISEFARDRIRDEARPLGFEYDTLKSRGRYFVFSKAVSENWDLCISVEDLDALEGAYGTKHFRPLVGIRHRHVRGDLVKAALSQFLLFRYQFLVPEFASAYMVFQDMEELRVLIKAHFTLYSLLANKLDDNLVEVMSSVDAP